ncbi:MAG: cobalamin-dependent protein [Sedimentisphaerales bacterium]|nr:cobalamin-dependent protein [Sedimentisphaerales bacterium]
MLALVNTNTMVPPIAPIGLDYIAGTARQADIRVDIIDLCWAEDTRDILRTYFSSHSPELVGLSFRNVDDCFWPSAKWFLPELTDTVRSIRSMTDAPVVIGGVGFSIFARQIVEYTGADFGIRGDGEQTIVSLIKELRGKKRFEKVKGLIWQNNGRFHTNPPAWPAKLQLSPNRDLVDNKLYFVKGGQCGLETKRGCNRRCIYCADALSKGTELRVRQPKEIADEAEALLSKGIDVLHLCDSEFNIPVSHAWAVCEEFNRRSLGKKLRWYTYMAVTPFEADLAKAMHRAGCVGIDFTGDSACPSMLKTYRQAHGKEELGWAVNFCRTNGIRVMIDLLLAGPGETYETLTETIEFVKHINPDCVGAPVGIRIYPGTAMEHIVNQMGTLEKNPNIQRSYSGPVDFLKPTFYISEQLGRQPAQLVNELIGKDERFFGPSVQRAEQSAQAEPASDHNYNDNMVLAEAIKNGARGAYWDILRKLRES